MEIERLRGTLVGFEEYLGAPLDSFSWADVNRNVTKLCDSDAKSHNLEVPLVGPLL